MSEPEIILEQASPDGNILAVVEQSETCCHFYLAGTKGSPFGAKSCWVRNFSPAPEQLETAKMQNGEAPMLPRPFCKHPGGAPRFQQGDLSIIWAEECDAAALTQNGEILSIIPGWSGYKGFHGYARDCTGESPICWSLGTPGENAQFAKYEKAAAYWASWSEEPGPWNQLQESFMNALEKQFGAHSNYYVIDGGNWPPKALIRIPTNCGTLLATIGISIRPQPMVDQYYDDPAPHRRFEFAMELDGTLPDSAVKEIASYISGQSTLPWTNHTFLGHGHAIPSDVVAKISGGNFSSVLLLKNPPCSPQTELPDFLGDPVNLLWMIPISEKERSHAQANGSAALGRLFSDANIGRRFSPLRKPVC